MDGTGYVATEVVAILVVVTIIGGALGWLLSRMASADGGGSEAGTGPSTADLETEITRLESANADLAGSAAQVEQLRTELAQAEWRVSTLEETLAAGSS